MYIYFFFKCYTIFINSYNGGEEGFLLLKCPIALYHTSGRCSVNELLRCLLELERIDLKDYLLFKKNKKIGWNDGMR